MYHHPVFTIQFKSLHLLLLVLSLVFTAGQGCSEEGQSFRQMIDNLAGQTPDGKTIRFADLDKKQLLINFFSESCPPCIEEVVSLREIDRRLAEKKDTAFYILIYLSNPEMKAEVTANFTKIWGKKAPLVFSDNVVPFPNKMIVATPETLLLRKSHGRYQIAYHFVGSVESSRLQRMKRDKAFTESSESFFQRYKVINPSAGNSPEDQQAFTVFRDKSLWENAFEEAAASKIKYAEDERLGLLLKMAGLKSL